MNFDIIKLTQYYDIEKLTVDVLKLVQDNTTSVTLSSTMTDFDMYTSHTTPLQGTAVLESDFTHLHPSLRNTVFEEIWKNNIDTIGRFRIMILQPNTSYLPHFDADYRHHLAVITNPDAVLQINNCNYHLPSDGSVYLCNTRKLHTAINNGVTRRIHLVWNDRNCE